MWGTAPRLYGRSDRFYSLGPYRLRSSWVATFCTCFLPQTQALQRRIIVNLFVPPRRFGDALALYLAAV